MTMMNIQRKQENMRKKDSGKIFLMNWKNIIMKQKN